MSRGHRQGPLTVSDPLWGQRKRNGGRETSEGFEVEAEQQLCTRTAGPVPGAGSNPPLQASDQGGSGRPPVTRGVWQPVEALAHLCTL